MRFRPKAVFEAVLRSLKTADKAEDPEHVDARQAN